MPRGVYVRNKKVIRKHGMCDYPEYKVWLSLRDRCKNPRNNAYHYYGGRGISVSKEWDNFKTFITDMGRRPEGYSLDRIDSNGNYSKENCRWATKVVQANNTRDNHKILYRGKLRGLRELSEITGITQKLLAKRLFERGWSVDRATENKSFIGRNQYSK